MIFQNIAPTFEFLKTRLGKHSPEAELYLQAECIVEIERLKKEKNAIILGHNYMEPALYQTVCDFRGDSLQLARESARTDADIIVFCGVEFMAETAKILNPTKKVLIPSNNAGCSLAQSITAENVRELKTRFPGVPVVTYINTYADVKAETDICCTSGNALKVIESLDSERIIFIPDEFLARNIARESGKTLIVPTFDPAESSEDKSIEKALIGWPGRCEVHERFTVEDIKNARKQYGDLVVLAHPECPPEVVEASDFSGSTAKMIDYVKETQTPHYLLLTECSMADNIVAENPEKKLLRLCSLRCPHMATISLEMTLKALQEDRYEITLEESLRIKAKHAIDRMLAIQ